MSGSANRYENMTTLRGLALIGVLAIHATAPIINPKYQSPSLWIDIFIGINQAARYSVPLFFFISGLIYGGVYAAKDIEYTHYINRRFKKILIPFFVWSFLYLAIRIITADIGYNQLNLKGFLGVIATGGAYGHLYFIPAIFQFYLLLPVLLLIAKRVSNSSLNFYYLLFLFLFMTLAYQWRITLLAEDQGCQIFTRSYWFFWWYPFAALGIQFGTGFLKIKLNIIFPQAAIFCCFAIICYEYISAYHQWPFYYSDIALVDINQIATFLRPSAFWYALSVCIFLFCMLDIEHFPNLPLVTELSKYSFGIYLAHPLINKVIIKLVKLLGVDLTHSIWSFLLLFFVGSATTFYLVKQSTKIKGFQYIVGDVRQDK